MEEAGSNLNSSKGLGPKSNASTLEFEDAKLSVVQVVRLPIVVAVLFLSELWC